MIDTNFTLYIIIISSLLESKEMDSIHRISMLVLRFRCFEIDLMSIILKFICLSLMRARNKKIVLIESINTFHGDNDCKFIDHNDDQMPMRIYRNDAEDEGSLAEIFYEALLNESIKKR
jgi:hypothetical protein